jgi:hypothetical protein
MQSATRQRLRAALGAALLAALAAAVGWPYVAHAFFSPDDYRYLALAADLASDFPAALPAAVVVENRWDASWWIPDGTCVRFFRPLVAPSYALDHALWGLEPRGFACTNLALYALLVLGAWRWLAGLVSSPAAAFLGAAVFAALVGHAENLYFLAGRTEVLAALPWIWALCIWQSRAPGWPRAWRAGVALFLALLGKEWAVLLVPLLLAQGWLVPRAPADAAGAPRAPGSHEPRAWPWRELLALGAALVLYLALRDAALGPAGSGARPFPYFHLPDRPGFGERALAVAAQYLASLGAATPVRPFLTGWDELSAEAGALEILAGAAFAGGVLFAAASERRGAWLALAFAATLLPLVPLYSTGRYLMLPSIAWAGMLALALERLLARRTILARAGVVALVLAAAAPQILRRREVVLTLPDAAAGRAAPAALTAAMLREAGIDAPGARRAVLVDFPGTWIDTQFLPELARVELGAEAPAIDVLLELPRTRAPLSSVEWLSEHSIRIERSGRPLVIFDPARPGMELDPRRVAAGERIREARFEVEVLAVDRQGRATAAAFHMDAPVDELDFYRGAWSEALGRWTLERFDSRRAP